MIGGQLVVHQWARLAIARECVVTAVVFRQLLFDDVGLDGDTDVIGLSGEIGRYVIIDAILFETIVSQIAPQNGEHAEIVRLFERFRDLLDLSRRLLGPKVDCGPDTARAQIVRLLHTPKHDLIKRVGVGHQFVVIDLDDERNAVRVATAH